MIDPNPIPDIPSMIDLDDIMLRSNEIPTADNRLFKNKQLKRPKHEGNKDTKQTALSMVRTLPTTRHRVKNSMGTVKDVLTSVGKMMALQ